MEQLNEWHRINRGEQSFTVNSLFLIDCTLLVTSSWMWSRITVLISLVDAIVCCHKIFSETLNKTNYTVLC